MLKCPLSVTRYKSPCFAPFGEATLSKALSVKNAHLLVYVIFCANMCFVYRGGKGYWQAKHEVEKIWFWWRMSGQLEMCAFFFVFTILRSFLLFSYLYSQPHSALRHCFISLITVLASRHMSYRVQLKQTDSALQLYTTNACRPQDWRARRRSILSESAPNWTLRTRVLYDMT